MKTRLRASLVIVGLALLSATPAAPRFVRHIDLLAVHLFRPLDAGLVALRARMSAPPPAPPPSGLDERVARGLAARDAVLRSGAEVVAPGRPQAVARVVVLDLHQRLLLIDAGTGVELSPGDPVLAGQYGVGRVRHAKDGVAVVETPFTPEARFAGACAGEEGKPAVRLVLTGLAGREWAAAVANPERLSGLEAGRDAVTPETGDLVPASIPTLPAGLRLGGIERDLKLARAGREAFCLRPRIDLAELDAVVVLLSHAPPSPAPSSFFVDQVARLSCGLASHWRDGANLTGFGLPEGGVVEVSGSFAGTIEAAFAGIARVRGAFDPGQDLLFLVMAEDSVFPLRARTAAVAEDGGDMTFLSGERVPRPGDLLVTTGRGPHVPRGLKVGTVLWSEGETFHVQRQAAPPETAVHVVWRRGMPDDPWKD